MPIPELDDPNLAYEQLRTRATQLVRAIKDDGFDSAVLRLISALIDVRATAQNETLAEVQQRLRGDVQ
jgi:hypothetical protein